LNCDDIRYYFRNQLFWRYAINRFYKIVIFLLTLSLFISCSQKSDTIKIGAILSLTGDFASHGKDAKKAIELAVEQVNSKGGIGGKEISVIYEDDKMQPSVGVSVFEKLTTIDKIQVVLGGIGSSVALSITPIAEKKKVVLISPTASNPKLTEAGDYFFRVWPSDFYEGRVMADFIYNLGIQKVGMLYVNNDFGQGLREVFGSRFKENGGQILIQEPYNQGSTDFRAQLSKIKNRNPDGIYLPGYYQEVAKILVQINEMGIRTKLFSTSPIENPELIKLAKKAAENIIYTRPAFDPQNPSEKYTSFSFTFKEKYGVDPGIAAAFSYDAICIILHSLAKLHVEGREIKGKMIQKSMAGIKNFPGVTGNISFDENGDVLREMALFTVRNGKFVPY